MKFFIFLFIFIGCNKENKTITKRAELTLDSVIDLKIDKLEISGLTIKDDKLLYVSDNLNDTFIYEVSTKGTTEFIDLKKLRGSDLYFQSIEKYKNKTKTLIDFEGITHCGDKFYLANERLREVLLVTNKEIRKLDIRFENDKYISMGFNNKGFEGITIDCENNHLYLAKERAPRRIFKIDLKTFNLIESFDLPHSDRQNQSVVNIFTFAGLMKVSPDFAGLSFYKGHLYVLERNTYEVSKIDPLSKKVIDRYSFIKNARQFQSIEPFGMAEALFVDDDFIWIGFDNNWSYRTQNAVEKYKIPYNRQGIILKFKK